MCSFLSRSVKCQFTLPTTNATTQCAISIMLPPLSSSLTPLPSPSSHRSTPLQSAPTQFSASKSSLDEYEEVIMIKEITGGKACIPEPVTKLMRLDTVAERQNVNLHLKPSVNGQFISERFKVWMREFIQMRNRDKATLRMEFEYFKQHKLDDKNRKANRGGQGAQTCQAARKE